jgi:DNA polymerase-3 subunit beta
MKCICDRSALHEALTATSSVIAARTPKPILGCIRVTAERNAMILTAYDQEVGLRYRITEVEVDKTGEVLVPGDRLTAIVRESQDETLALESEAEVLHIRGADSHFQVLGQNVREFPPVPDMEGEPDFSVKMADLRDAVEKTVFAAARESTRYAINGVLWQQMGKRLQLVATDGRRLALSAAPLEKAGGNDLSAIVPIKPLKLLSGLRFDADELVHVRIMPNQIVMRTDRATISTVLVEGHFPKWEDVVPRDLDKKLTLQTSKFLSAVTRAALLANMESKGIRIQLRDGKMVLSSRSPEQGEATVSLEVEDYTGQEVVIGFNPEYLKEALKVCEETVTLELKETAKPGVLTSGPSFKCVVMPVNLS